MEDKIRAYIEANFLIEFDDELTRDSDLFKEGIMDSFGYVSLLEFLQEEFDLDIGEDELTSNVLVSLAAICDFVAERAGTAGA